jgi:transcriptional regulatory protein RtcR
MRKPFVVFSLLGPTLDGGPRDARRWEKWRPTVSLCQHEDLIVDRLELLYQPEFESLAREVAADIGTCSPETQVRPTCVPLADPWDFEEVYAVLLDVAQGYAFDLEGERYGVHITTGTHVAQISLFLLTEARFLPGTLVQTSPSPNRRVRGQGVYRLIDLDLSRYDQIAARFEAQRSEGVAGLKSGIATRNAAFNELIDRIGRVALASRDPILLTGPTGAGKSQLARRIYELRRARRLLRGAFVEVNCATLRGDSAMSALFGHEKGAFTGAAGARGGLMRAADGGMLFLDEIGELGLDEQAMLLRAVEEKRFLPVGADREAESEFALVCGTNRDLRAAAREGRFREDLLARLDLWTFRLPGLAERREDIAPNLDYEIERFERRADQRVTLSSEARAAFLAFATGRDAPWRGNFRDLGAAVTRMATLAPGGRITRDVVDAETARLRQSWAPGEADVGALDGLLGADRLAEIDLFDRVQLEAVVRTCRASATLSDAGRTLFAASRRRRASRNDADRLRKYLARYGLSWEAVQAGAQA